jgi:maltooligosyltrehalose synthase
LREAIAEAHIKHAQSRQNLRSIYFRVATEFPEEWRCLFDSAILVASQQVVTANFASCHRKIRRLSPKNGVGLNTIRDITLLQL